MRYWTVLPEWTGGTAYIVAGGPSASIVLQMPPPPRRTIVINDSFRLVPDAAILYFCDAKWWERNKQDVGRIFKGKWIVTLENEIDGVFRLRNSGRLGLETDPAALRHGSNSGYQAINLAYHLGAARIVLIGYDMKVDGERTHWFGSRTGQPAATFSRTLAERMLPCFESIAEELRRSGVEVLNATPGSTIRCFPFVDLRDLVS